MLIIVWKVDLRHTSAEGKGQSISSVFSPLFILLVKNFRKVGPPPPPDENSWIRACLVLPAKMEPFSRYNITCQNGTIL